MTRREAVKVCLLTALMLLNCRQEPAPAPGASVAPSAPPPVASVAAGPGSAKPAPPAAPLAAGASVALPVPAASESAAPSASAAPAATPPKGKRIAALFRKEVTKNPNRWLDCLDMTSGVVVARTLDCETEEVNYVDDFRRVCGPAARNVLAPVFASMASRARNVATYSQQRGPLFECKAWGRYQKCQVPPMNECESAFFIVFDEAAATCRILAVIERDDWQAPPELQALTDARIEATLSGASPCPRY